ncbi:MAG: hypothetical protein ABI851_10080 [Saprospiraceae bacterium]
MKNIFYLVFIIFVFGTSCKKDNPTWDVGILTPLVKTSFSLKNLVNDSIYKLDSAQLIHFVFNRNLYNLSLDSFFSISDTTISKSFSIDSLKLYNINIRYPLSLGEIAKQSGSIGALIIALNGNKLAIPALGPLSVPKVEFNADTLFTSMTLDDGKIDISFNNNLPVDITNVNFILRNANNNATIVQGSFPLIKSNSTESQTFSLAGQTVESKISIEVTNFSSPGSQGVPVLIDTSSSIIANLKVYDLRPSKATAIWPAQNIIEQHLDFNLRRLEVFLKYAKIKNGTIYLKLSSTIDDTLHFEYKLPGATKNGMGFEIIKKLLPGTISNPSVIYQEYDFSGYDLDLSGSNKDTFNATPNSIIVSIDATGIQKTFSKADNILVELGFKELKPSYAIGYLGSKTFAFGPSTVDLDFFKDVNGIINFEDISLGIEIENKIGANGELEISKFKANNIRNNSSAELVSPLLNQKILIDRATDMNGMLPINATQTKINFDKGNSNINNLASILPDNLEYALNLKFNPQGNISNYKDFLYDGRLLNVNLMLDVPMHFAAKGLSLMKTQNFDSDQIDFEKVIDGILYLNVENQFPISAIAEIKFIDDSGQSVLELYKIDGLIQAATVPPSGIVIDKKKSLISIPINQQDIQALKHARKVTIKAIFDTPSNQIPVKLYDNYSMDIILSASFNYKVD